MSSNLPTVYIGLGSNLDNPAKQITTALAELKHMPQTQLIRHSSLYQTQPVGPQAQPDFINACAELSTTLSPETLLTELRAIEQKHQRQRFKRWGPRTLDLDILLYGNQIIQTEKLTIPHPEMTKRAFVIVPLAEIAPTLILPDQRSVTQLRRELLTVPVPSIGLVSA